MKVAPSTLGVDPRTIKPCPFCGGTPTMRYVKRHGREFFSVVCQGNDAGPRRCGAFPEGRRGFTPEEAVENWNIRAGGK